RARNKIKHWLNEHQRVRAIEIGRKLLEREARKHKLSLAKFATADLDRIANDYGLGNEQDLLAGIGFGKYSTRQVLNKLEPGSTMPAETPQPEPGKVLNTISHMSNAVKRVFFGKGSDSLQVEGQDDLLVYRARCCNPIRGEEIIGYVTRGKGVAVHARSCSNVQNLLYEADRRIEVAWAAAPPDKGNSPKQQTYPVKLTLLCDDRSGLLKEFTAIISDDGTNIRSVETRPTPDGIVYVDFVIETVDVRHLTKLTNHLRKVPGVRDIQRVQKI
ncbi:MAG: ACT domain-containing protein, partial [Acidobacteriota bacterium]|nr:ACT domain-containing protein [Acidobacteriota bacterium]